MNPKWFARDLRVKLNVVLILQKSAEDIQILAITRLILIMGGEDLGLKTLDSL